jgi:hypothetical protein
MSIFKLRIVLVLVQEREIYKVILVVLLRINNLMINKILAFKIMIILYKEGHYRKIVLLVLKDLLRVNNRVIKIEVLELNIINIVLNNIS